MLSMSIRHIGLYRRAETNHYRAPAATIGLTISGLVYMHTMGVEAPLDGPFFSLLPASTEVDFHFGPERENIAIIADGDWLRHGPSPGTVVISAGADSAQLPCFIPVSAARLPGWREELTRMLDAFSSPTPRNRLRMKLGVSNILRHLLDQEVDSLAASPAVELKRRIDADGTHHHSLAELSEQCGYSADHMRLLFQERYSLSPNDYRQQRRLARAMELIANSRLSAKEIAFTCGFAHAAHLSTAFRQAFGLSPRQAIHHYRHTDRPGG